MADDRITIDKNFDADFRKIIGQVFTRYKTHGTVKSKQIQPRDSVYIYEYDAKSGDVDFKVFINLVGVEDSGWIFSTVLKGNDIKRIKTQSEFPEEIPSKSQFLKALYANLKDAFDDLQQRYGLPLIKKSSNKTSQIIDKKEFLKDPVKIIASLIIQDYPDEVISKNIDLLKISSEIVERLPIVLSNYKESIDKSFTNIIEHVNSIKRGSNV